MTPKQKLALEGLKNLPPESRKKVARQALQLIKVKEAKERASRSRLTLVKS